MDIEKYGKLPPANYDVLAHNKKRRALYLEGLKYIYCENGEAKDFEKAYPLIKQAAEMNDPYAITSIGSFYHMGKIVPQDDSQALKIYLKMYRRLNPNSAFNLSFMYRKGLGTKIDIELSKKYYLDSIIFAIREACNKDESGYQYLKEVVHLSAEYIEECVDRYRKRPICELCHGIVPHENLKAITNNEITSLDLRQKLFNVILNNDFKRGKPVINIGFCCFRCEQLYVEPIRRALKSGNIFKEEVALLEHRDDLIEALNIFVRIN